MSTPSTSSSPSNSDDVRWFAEEVHAHDSMLKAYVRASFPRVGDVEDVVQESYLRIWRARAGRPIQSAKAFLFRIARNICLDSVKSTNRSPINSIGDLAAIAVYDQAENAADSASATERLEILTDALAALPPRCREVFMLCKFQGFSHAEAARRLGLSVRTVDAQVQNGFARLGKELRRRGLGGTTGK